MIIIWFRMVLHYYSSCKNLNRGRLRGLPLLYRRCLPNTTLIVDAGIGRPSQAAQVMELGYDGVLLNTAVAHANCPITMAMAFQQAILAGHHAYCAGIMPERNRAVASTPLLETPFWQQQSEFYEKS